MDPDYSPNSLADLLATNRANWDERTGLHLKAYPVADFRAGKSTLHSIEQAEVGDVRGKSLLHLQCHFGLDTLSWARCGATVTGVDFSPPAVAAARALSDELHINATFICSDVYELPSVLKEQFDIVFTSYGVLPWLPDVRRWAKIAAGYVRPGGVLYIIDGHPLGYLLDDLGERPERGMRYFHDDEPSRWEQHGSYVGEPTRFEQPVTYQWQHSLGDVVSAVIEADLRLEFLHEWPFAEYRAFEGLERASDGYWHLADDIWPLLFSLRARRPQ